MELMNVGLGMNSNGEFKLQAVAYQIIFEDDNVFFIKDIDNAYREYQIIKKSNKILRRSSGIWILNEITSCANVSYNIFGSEIFITTEEWGKRKEEIKADLCKNFEEALVNAKIGKGSSIYKSLQEFLKAENINY